MSEALQIVIDSNPAQFISCANLTRPELVYTDPQGNLVHYPMPPSFVAFPVDDAPSELQGVDVVQITDAHAQ